MGAATAITPDSLRQDQVNRAVYHTRGVQRYYLSTQLTPSETACLLKYQPSFSGRDVLDIGVGAGRTTRHLAPLARRYEAVDYSPVMVGYLKQAMPGVSVREADFRDLRVFEDRSFDFVFAPDNVIDALSHLDRLKALGEACRVLNPGGVLAFSTHNVRYKTAFHSPRLALSKNPVQLAKNVAKFALGCWNHRRVGPLRITTPEYALLNDTGHFYACLHYYSARPTVAAQLAQSGLRLIDVFDRNGSMLAETAGDSDNPSLLYVARRESS